MEDEGRASVILWYSELVCLLDAVVKVCLKVTSLVLVTTLSTVSL